MVSIGNQIIPGGIVSGPKFSRNLHVAFRDRGLGRGDYGILAMDGPLIAELKGMHHIEGGNPAVEILPVHENAFLFAAAPELYDACLKALPLVRKSGDKAAFSAIKAALKKATPPKPSRKRR